MDLPRPALLKQLQLFLSAEGRGFTHYVHDLGTGKILSVPRSSAAALRRFRQALSTTAGAREKLDPEDARESYVVLSYLRSVRDAERLKRGRFNPMFMQINLFDVGPLQRRIEGFAMALVGWPLALVVLVLAIVAFMLGIRNDWAIAAEFGNIFSLSALATFALIAPVLKIVHEFGHVVFAAWAGVRVRKAGVNLIGLYPLPYVDCTEADISARRRDRILISLAGVITDFIVGLIAFIAWHMVEGDFLRGLAGRIVVFSTVSSLLFNANPLIKLDGYFALVDLIGQRNMGTRATQVFAEARNWLTTLGAKGSLPKDRGQVALAAYGVGSWGYRITVLYHLVMQLLPQYLGLGAVIAAWGGYAMFGAPLLADLPVKRPEPAEEARRLLPRRLGFVALVAAVMLFVPLPLAMHRNFTLDGSDRYVLTTGKDGFVDAPVSAAGQVALGDALLHLSNGELERQREIMALSIGEAKLLSEMVRGIDAAQAQMAADNLFSVMAKSDVLNSEAESLTVRAPASGVFLPHAGLRSGQYLAEGSAVGQFLPASGRAALVGEFPERWVEKFQNELSSIEVWDQILGYRQVDPTDVRLVETVRHDAQSGVRSFAIEMTLGLPPSAFIGRDVQVRMGFGWQPLWRHVVFWGQGRIQAFRDAQLADRLQRIGLDARY